MERRPLRVVVTGFGRFPGAPVNPTAVLAGRLVHSRRAALAGLSVAAHVFATRYQAVDLDLPGLLAREKPDALIMFGVAVRAKHVRVELVARNRKSILFPDAGGATAAGPVITPGGPAMRRGHFSPPAILAALRGVGVPAVTSRNAGPYLCNYVYWRALERVAQPGAPRVMLFVHVPPVCITPRPLQPVPISKGSPARPQICDRSMRRRTDLARRLKLSPADLRRAGEAVLLAAAAMARKPPGLPRG